MKKIKLFPFLREVNIAFFVLELVAIILLFVVFFISVDYKISISLFFGGFLLFQIIHIIQSIYVVNYFHNMLFVTKNYFLCSNGLFVYKKFARKKYTKVTLNEYFHEPFVGGNWGTNFREKRTNMTPREKDYFNPVFIVYSEFFDEKFPWDEETNHPKVIQQCFDAYCEKMLDKNILLLDATYGNYRFLRQYFSVESFKDTRMGGENILEQYEKRLSETN